MQETACACKFHARGQDITGCYGYVKRSSANERARSGSRQGQHHWMMNLFTSTNGSFSLCGRNNRTGTGKSSNTQILNQQQVNSAMLNDKHYRNTFLKNNCVDVKKAPQKARAD